MLTVPPCQTLKKFVLALQNHKQAVISQREEYKLATVNHNEAFFGQ